MKRVENSLSTALDRLNEMEYPLATRLREM
jgi:hypothetical protein